MSQNLSAKYYQEKKESFQKKLRKDIKMFLKKNYKNSHKMVINVTKISQKMKNKRLLSIEKNIKELEKMFYCNYKKLLFQKIMT